MAETIVRADPSQTWRYGRIMTAAFCVMSPLLALCALAADAIHGFRAYAAVTVGTLLLGVAYGFGMGLIWRYRSARVAYIVDDRGLTVTRGDKTVYFVQRDQITSFHMVGKVDLSECLLVGQAPPPSWPHGIVGVEQPGKRSHFFPNKLLPEIMIWGRTEALAAEWKIQQALRATGPLPY